MLIKNVEKLRKRTLRERIYEEVVRLIVTGELPSGGWVDEKQVIDKLRVSRTPFREAIGILAKGGRRLTFTNYTSGLNVSRSSSPSRK